MDDLSFLGINENRLVWKNKGRPYQKLDLKDVFSKGFKVADLDVVPNHQGQLTTIRSQYFVIIFLFLGGVFIVLYFISVRPKIHPTPEPESFETSPDKEVSKALDIWDKLHQADGLLLSTVQLDVLLGITSTNLENRKAKRSKMIKILNEQGMVELGQEVIIRERDPNDKRFFRFRIEFKKP